MLTVTDKALSRLQNFLDENQLDDTKAVRIILNQQKKLELIADTPRENDDSLPNQDGKTVLVIDNNLSTALNGYTMDFSDDGGMTITRQEQ